MTRSLLEGLSEKTKNDLVALLEGRSSTLSAESASVLERRGLVHRGSAGWTLTSSGVAAANNAKKNPIREN